MLNIALMFAISSVQAAAQSQPTVLTLQDAVQLSLAHSAVLTEARARANAAHGRKSIESAKLNPKLNFNGRADKYDAPTNVNFGGTSVEVLPNHLETLQVELKQVLDFSGNLSASVAEARLNEMAADYDANRVSQQEVLGTKLDFYTVLRAMQDVVVSQADLAAQTSALDLATKRHTAGTGQQVDVLRAQAQVADAARRLEESRNQERLAASRLNDRLGRSLDTPTDLKDDYKTVIDPAQATKLMDLLHDAQVKKADWTALAQAQRPEVLVSTMQVEAAKKGITVASTTNSPSVALSLGGAYYPTFSLQTPRQSTGTLSLIVSVPLYDGGEDAARRSEAKSNLVAAQSNLEDTKRKVALDVQQASLNATSILTRLQSANAALTAAIEARRLAQVRYENEVGLYQEVNDTQAALVASQRAQLDAAYDALVAKAEVEYALGQTTNPR